MSSRVIRWCSTCDRALSAKRSETDACGTHGKTTVTWTAIAEDRTGLKRRRKIAKGFATKGEASAKAAELLVAISNGLSVDKSDLTLAGWLDEYLNRLELTVEQDDGIKASTLTGYQGMVRKSIGPRLGGIRLQVLNSQHLDDFYTEMRGDGYSPQTVKNHHILIRRCLQVALKRKLIAANPAAEPDVAPSIKGGSKQPTVWELAKVIEFLASVHGHRFETFFQMAFGTGARRGELLGVRWSDIDFDGDTAVWTVRRALVQIKGGTVETTPKSRRPRQIALDADLVTLLLKHRKDQIARRLSLGDMWLGDENRDNWLVFDNGLGAVIYPAIVSRAFQKAVKDSGITPVLRLHDCRHSHASNLLALGVPVKDVQERLGHATAAFTLDVYGSVLPSQRAVTADRWAEALRAAK